jgi:hypothetical protein
LSVINHQEDHILGSGLASIEVPVPSKGSMMDDDDAGFTYLTDLALKLQK